MKHIFFIGYTLLVLLFVGKITAFAQLQQQAPQSVLHLRLTHNMPCKVTFDGNKNPEVRKEHTIVTTAGRHKLRVLLPPPPSHPYSPNITVFGGKITLKPNTEVFAYIDRNGNFRIHREVPLQYGSSNMPSQNPYPPVQPENPYESQNEYQPQPQPAPVPAPIPTPTPVQVMASQQFEQLKQIIRDKPFDDDRLVIAKQAISTNKLSSDQVRDLLNGFSFEASRLDIAKFAYGYCADPQNYQVVYSGFKFNSSTNELIEYMKSYKP